MSYDLVFENIFELREFSPRYHSLCHQLIKFLEIHLTTIIVIDKRHHFFDFLSTAVES